MNEQYDMRPITAEEYAVFANHIESAFHAIPAEENLDTYREGFEYDRSLAVFDGKRLVATAGIFTSELTLPGLTRAPAAAVVAVSVSPAYRRRGLLRRMMARQLDDVRQRCEPLAILTASESSIYQQFGYGLASEDASFAISTDHAAFRYPVSYAGSVDLVDHDTAREVLPVVFEAARVRQIGSIRPDPPYWRQIFDVPTAERVGDKSRFYVVATSARNVPEAYAIYSVKREWPNGIRNSTLEMRSLIAADDRARSAIWQFLLSRIDLVQTVVISSSPVDEPLRWHLADPRQLRSRSRNDTLWLRVLDVPSALSARRYSVSGSLVLEVHDRFRPETAGRFELEGSPEGAACRRTGREPDLSLQIEDLGALFLGGVSPSTLARAGRVQEESAGALHRADALFAVDRAPWCPVHF